MTKRAGTEGHHVLLVLAAQVKFSMVFLALPFAIHHLDLTFLVLMSCQVDIVDHATVLLSN